MVTYRGDGMSDEELIALFDNHNTRLESYRTGLEKDFPKPGQLTSYIQALEQFAAGKLGTKSRQETYIKVIRDHKKKSGRPSLTYEEMQSKLDEVDLIRKENPNWNLETACGKVGITAKTRRVYINKLKINEH